MARPRRRRYVDQVEVERLMNGDRTIPMRRANAHTPEFIEAIRRLAASGCSDGQISQRLGDRISRDAVFKIRLRSGIPSGLATARMRVAS